VFAVYTIFIPYSSKVLGVDAQGKSLMRQEPDVDPCMQERIQSVPMDVDAQVFVHTDDHHVMDGPFAASTHKNSRM